MGLKWHAATVAFASGDEQTYDIVELLDQGVLKTASTIEVNDPECGPGQVETAVQFHAAGSWRHVRPTIVSSYAGWVSDTPENAPSDWKVLVSCVDLDGLCDAITGYLNEQYDTGHKFRTVQEIRGNEALLKSQNTSGLINRDGRTRRVAFRWVSGPSDPVGDAASDFFPVP